MTQHIENTIIEEFLGKIRDILQENDEKNIRELIDVINNDEKCIDIFGLNTILRSFQTAQIAFEEIGLKREGIIAILLYRGVLLGILENDSVREKFGNGVADIVGGIAKVQSLYEKTPTISSENFKNLLLSFAEDMRVILIMIADRVNLMREIKDCENTVAVQKAAEEASYLYAPLAHKLGLYQLKSELEDLSLKYLEHDAYYHIKEKLNATKAARDKYIEQFIIPIQTKLEQLGL